MTVTLREVDHVDVMEGVQQRYRAAPSEVFWYVVVQAHGMSNVSSENQAHFFNNAVKYTRKITPLPGLCIYIFTVRQFKWKMFNCHK